MQQARTHTWHWEFDQDVERIWPILVDTARFNEAAGLPRYSVEEIPQPDGSVRYFAKGRAGAHALEWEELPTNWVEHRWYTHERRFGKGPFGRVQVRIAMEAVPGGCVCHYTLEVEPATLAGRLLLATGFFTRVGRKFAAMSAQARAFAGGAADLPFEFPAPQLATGAHARCAQLVEALATSPYVHDLQERLAHWILERPDADVVTIRPKALAKIWQRPEREVIELCLAAASAGLLSLRWDLLCPNCRVSKSASARMDEIPQGTHCGTCNIDYSRNFDRNVELAFLPSKSLRLLQSGEFCLFGPLTTPHVKLQLSVPPRSTRVEPNPLAPGHYRIRTLERGNDHLLEWQGGAFPQIAISADGELLLDGPASTGMLHLANAGDRPRIVIVEERAWTSEVLTAQEAATLQCFRELFHDQILRPGDHVEIDNVVLMFTDIKASTALYNRIGDAAAYALVREHFAILAACVRRHDGSIVKTIGDAIMAAFNVPLDGLRCALAIQQAFAAFNAGRADRDDRVNVKLGMHMGPCISVTLNGILDYYGKAANLTARLAGLGEGGDIVLSTALAQDPAVACELESLAPQCEEAPLKGFTDNTPYLRISAATLANRSRR